MKLLTILALAVALHAEDTKPLATVEQLQAKVAERDQQISNLQRQLTQTQQSAQQFADAYQGCAISRAQIDAQLKQKPAKETK